LSCSSPPPSRGRASTVLGQNCSTWSAPPSPTRASYSTSPSRCIRPSESATGSGHSRPTAEPGTFPPGPSPTLSASRETSRPGGTSGAERHSSLGFGSTSADRRAFHGSLGGRTRWSLVVPLEDSGPVRRSESGADEAAGRWKSGRVRSWPNKEAAVAICEATTPASRRAGPYPDPSPEYVAPFTPRPGRSADVRIRFFRRVDPVGPVECRTLPWRTPARSPGRPRYLGPVL